MPNAARFLQPSVTVLQRTPSAQWFICPIFAPNFVSVEIRLLRLQPFTHSRFHFFLLLWNCDYQLLTHLQWPTAVSIPQHKPLHQFVVCRCRAPCSAWWRCASHSPTLLLPSARSVSPAVARVASCHCQWPASAAKVSNVSSMAIRRHVISGRTWLTVCPHIRKFTLYSAMAGDWVVLFATSAQNSREGTWPLT